MSDAPPCLGIVAGRGQLVDDIVQACLTQKRPYFVLALEGQTDPDFAALHPHGWSTFAQIGRSLELLKAANVKEIIMVGAMKRPTFSHLKVDFIGAKWMAGMVGKSLGDDGLLRYIADHLEREGFKIVSAESVLGNKLFAPLGCLSKKAPDARALQDIERGLHILKVLSHEDVGQAIVIQEGLVLGVEAIEGTDALIERCAGYIRPGHAKPTLIKMCKKGQDLRMDRPTIGRRTLENLAKAGFAGMAYEAGGVIFLERQALTDVANQKGLFLYGVNGF